MRGDEILNLSPKRGFCSNRFYTPRWFTPICKKYFCKGLKNLNANLSEACEPHGNNVVLSHIFDEGARKTSMKTNQTK